jgi:hypothetical protein
MKRPVFNPGDKVHVEFDGTVVKAGAGFIGGYVVKDEDGWEHQIYVPVSTPPVMTKLGPELRPGDVWDVDGVVFMIRSAGFSDPSLLAYAVTAGFPDDAKILFEDATERGLKTELLFRLNK